MKQNQIQKVVEARIETKVKNLDKSTKILNVIMRMAGTNKLTRFTNFIYKIFTTVTFKIDKLFKTNIADEVVEINKAKTSIYYSKQGDNKKALLFFPGGGYYQEGISGHYVFAKNLSQINDIDVFVTQYTLSDEAPYPAALNDVLDVYNHLINKLDYMPENITVAGDSAGGHLTLSLLLELKKQVKPMPAAAILFSPWADMRHSSGSFENNKKVDLLLSAERLDDFKTRFLARTNYSESDPEISLVLAELNDLPPLLIFASVEEVLLNDSIRLYENAKTANIPVRFFKYKDTNDSHVPHSWIAVSRKGELYDDVMFEIKDFLVKYMP